MLFKQLNQLADNAPGVLYQYQRYPDGRICFPYATEGIKDVLGVAPEQAAQNAEPILARLHPDDIESVLHSIEDSADTLKVWETQFRYCHPDKGVRWLEGRATPNRTPDNSVIWNGYLYDITERKQQEIFLQDTQTRFQLTMEATDTGLWSWDLLTDQVLWSAEAYRQLGYEADAFAMSLEQFRQLLHPQDTDRMMTDVTNSLKQGKGFDTQFRLRHRNGDWVWIQGRGKVTDLDNQGQPLFMRGTHVNISSLKQTEQALETHKERLVLATESAGLGIWDYDAQSGYLEWDEGMYRLYGMQPMHFQNQLDDWMATLIPEERESVLQRFNAALADQNKLTFEFSILRRHDQQRRVLHCDARIIRGASGDVLRVVGINRDITEQHDNQKALEAEERKFRGLFEDAPVGIAMNDFQTGAFLDINRALYEPAGYTEAEFKALSYWDITPREYEADEEKQLTQMELTGRYGPFEKEYMRKDGSRYPVLLNGFKTTTAEGKAVIWSIIQDISERKDTEQRIAAAKAAADAANRAKSDFLANMSHEIRTPMNGILGLSQLGLNDQDAEQMQDRLRKIYQSGRLLLGIINDILDFSKIEAGKLDIAPHPFRLSDLLDNLNNLFTAMAADKGLTLRIETDSALDRAYRCDELRLRQILTNLISNAIKFTSRGSVTLTVTAVGTEPDDGHNRHSRKLQFRVQDTGIGIDPEQQSRLFKAFSQADSSIARQYGGSGLGLVISQRLAQALGSDGIELQSTPGEGACFSFILPLTACDISEVPEAIHNQQVLPVTLQGQVLLVEDNAINQEVARSLLLQLGLSVISAGDGSDVLPLLEKHTFDLVLMDIQMPVMNGYEATRQLRRCGYHLPVIALTAGAMADDQERALNSGMDDYLSKPIEPRQLQQCLRRWLDQEQVIQNKTAAVSATPSYTDTSSTDASPTETSDTKCLFDTKAGLAMLAGDSVLYDKLLRQFLEQFEAEYPNLKHLLSHLTPDQLAEAQANVHALKGVAGNLIMPHLTYQAVQLDQQLRQQSLPPEADRIAFISSLEQTLTAIKQWLAEHSPPPPEAKPVAGTTTSGAEFDTELAAVLQSILVAIQGSEFIDDQQLRQVSEKIPQHLQPLWDDVCNALDAFEFDDAETQLQQLIQHGQ